MIVQNIQSGFCQCEIFPFMAVCLIIVNVQSLKKWKVVKGSLKDESLRTDHNKLDREFISMGIMHFITKLETLDFLK